MKDDGTATLLTGAIDMHVHSSPDFIPRKLSDIALARAAHAAGLAGLLLKCHHSPTTARAALAGECVPGIKVFGGLVLNRPAGGLNPAAVETELSMGAKEIWLPTVSAENHIRIKGGDPREAVPVFDPAGRIHPELMIIFELIAARGAILGTGHLSPLESEAVIAAAQDRGVEKIVVTHPEWELTAMPLAMQKSLARRGVYFERCFFASNSPQQLPPEAIAGQIRAVGVDSTVLASDLGQIENEAPPEGLHRLLSVMMAAGFTRSDLDIMVIQNPRSLLNYQQAYILK